MIARIKPNIVFVDDLATNPEAVVLVRLAPDGRIIGHKLVRSSGVREWDQAVQRAIERTEVLPRDVDGRVPSSMEITFRPRE
ncbi:energy transducer TonB [Piscinibacter sakaiensis]|uniref:energy transducer TonB n=1 Tax=Piscinibacter sakaiensis TaxID=1547922 RepID=UPI003727CD13